METERMDSLEDWVAVKESAFVDESTPPRLVFMVSWNDVEHKIAVTCRARSRVARDTDDCSSRSTAFSTQELKGIMQVLSLVHPSLANYFPHFPDEPRGIWAIFSTPKPPENAAQICQDLEKFFFMALDVCKERLLMATLFEEPDTKEYFESMGELRKQGLLEEMRNAEEELKNLEFEREQCTAMKDYAELYVREDVSLNKLLEALAHFYNWELQPFLDLREMALKKAQNAKDMLQNPDVGNRVKEESKKAFTEWQAEHVRALDVIQDLYIVYYSRTSDLYRDLLSKMEEDRQRFGKNAFELVAAERVLRLKTQMHKENVQLLQNKRKQHIQERDKVKEEIGFLAEGSNIRAELERLERTVYLWQCRIMQIELDIMHQKEMIVQTQIQSRRRLIDGWS